MDAAMVVALGGIATAIGAGIWKLIERADKKKERQENEAKTVYERLLKEAERKLEAAEATIKARDHQILLMRQDGNDWNTQIQLLGGTPKPARWRDLEAIGI